MRPLIAREDLGELEISAQAFDDLLSDHEHLVERYMPEWAGGRSGLRTEETVVIGVGVAEEVVNGVGTGRPALKLLVKNLSATQLLPLLSPSGFPIIIEEVGEIVPTFGFQAKSRPVVCGISVAPCPPWYDGNYYSGTLGCLVRLGNTKCILSNNHVLAYENFFGPGTTISQQAIGDGGGCPADVAATLNYVVPLVNNGASLVDAAIAACSPNVQFDARLLRNDNSLEKMGSPVTSPVLNMNVQKSGRTTGHTKGKVTAIGIAHWQQYSPPALNQPPLTTTFSNVFTVKRVTGDFCQTGDSGSVVTNDPANQPVGLLFARDTLKSVYCNRMSDVLQALNTGTGQTATIVY